MDEEMSKLVAVKIIQTYTQAKEEAVNPPSLSITVRRFFSFWTILH